MKEFTSFSSGMLKTFEQCEKKFLHKYINGISLPMDISKAQQGKNIHALASYYLKGFNIDKLEKTLSEKELGLWNSLKNNKYFNLEVVKSEYSTTAKIGEFWINGRFDALMKDKNNYYILDYKTGSIPKNPEEDYQTIIYLLIADKIIKEYENLTFIYIDLKNNKNVEIKFNEEMKQKYENKLKNILEQIKRCIITSVFKTLNTECMCEYSKICNNFC